MAQTTQTGIKATAIKAPTNYLENHTMVLQQLKETTEIAQRLRGDYLDSYVRVRELVDAGIIRFTNGVVQPPNTASATSAVPLSRSIFTGGSLTGGGDLSVNRTHSLVNDITSPGSNYFYGTTGPGTKGWFPHSSLAVQGAPGPAVFLEADPGEDGPPGPPGPPGPAGAQGAAAQPGLAAFGEMTAANNAVATAMTTINTFYQLTGGISAGDLNSFTFGSSALTALLPGSYLTTAVVSLGSATTSNLVVNIQVFKNGSALPSHNGYAKLTNTTDIDSVSLTGIITGVNAGDVFDIRIQSTSNSGQSVTAMYVNLSIIAVHGARGPVGPPGYDGLDGEDGPLGPPGQAGVAGSTGAQGPLGPAVFLEGDIGETGDLGPPGIQGLTGPTGSTGAQGPMGPAVFLDADPAEDGQIGPQGVTGPQGQTGSTGAQGPMGPAVFLDADPAEDGQAGPPGATGAQGQAGSTGAQGPMGPAVFLDADPAEDGQIGPPGVQGPQGPQGIPGTSGSGSGSQAVCFDPQQEIDEWASSPLAVIDNGAPYNWAGFNSFSGNATSPAFSVQRKPTSNPYIPPNAFTIVDEYYQLGSGVILTLDSGAELRVGTVADKPAFLPLDANPIWTGLHTFSGNISGDGYNIGLGSATGITSGLAYTGVAYFENCNARGGITISNLVKFGTNNVTEIRMYNWDGAAISSFGQIYVTDVNFATAGGVAANSMLIKAGRSNSNIYFAVSNLNPTLTIGVNGSTFTNSFLGNNAASRIGFATGAGNTVSQATSRTTGVSLNAVCGAITMFSAAGSATFASFTFTNSVIAATDIILLNQRTGTNLYHFIVTAVAAGSCTISFATTGGTATDAPVINFAIIKSVTA